MNTKSTLQLLSAAATLMVVSATLQSCTREVSAAPDYSSLGEAVQWDSFESPYISDPRQLTTVAGGFRRAGEGYFSRDGYHMVFQAEAVVADEGAPPEPGADVPVSAENANPFFQIYVMEMTTGAHHRVSPGVGRTTCAFFRPHSNDLEFSSSHLDPDAPRKQKDEYASRAAGERRRVWDYDETMDIFVCDRSGDDLRQLTTEMGYDAEAAYSPDGSKIVFSSTRHAYPIDALSPELQEQAAKDVSFFGELYMMNADGTDVTRLTEWDGYDGGPFFTPDGRRVVWRHFDASGRTAEVYTMKLDGTDRRQLTELGAMSWAPYFHPSGEYCIFTTNLHGYQNFELYMVDAMGEKEPVRVTTADAFDGLPVFTPDGDHLCWTASRTPNEQGQLFMASWDDAAARAALAAAPPRGEGPPRDASAERPSGH